MAALTSRSTSSLVKDGDGGTEMGNGEATMRESERKRKDVLTMLERARKDLDVKALMAGAKEEEVAGAEGLEGLGEVEERVRRWEGVVLSLSDRTHKSTLDLRGKIAEKFTETVTAKAAD